jgi:hypothetical protein
MVRPLAQGALLVLALALAWIGYLAVGSWEATDASTAAGAVLIGGAGIAVGFTLASLRSERPVPLLLCAATASALAWLIAVLAS